LNEIEFAAIGDKSFTFLEGDFMGSDGKRFSSTEYGKHLKHVSVPYSHASAYRFDGKIYMVGALARLNLFKETLHKKTIKSAEKYLKLFPSKNIFHNNLAQALEILHAVDASIEIISNLKIAEEKPLVPARKKSVGIAVIEAPRGALYYRLKVDEKGRIKDGQIVVPTGQNQISIEESIKKYLKKNLDCLDNKEKIEIEIEKIVRAFDPCMSCAAHFLKVKWIQE